MSTSLIQLAGAVDSREDLTALELCENQLFVGCLNGELLQFSIRSESKHDPIITTLQRKIRAARMAISKIICVPSEDRLIYVTQNTIKICTLDTLEHVATPPASTSVLSNILDAVPDVMVTSPLRVAVVKRRTIVLVLVDQGISVEKELALPHTPVSCSLSGNTLVYADRTGGFLISLSTVLDNTRKVQVVDKSIAKLLYSVKNNNNDEPPTIVPLMGLSQTEFMLISGSVVICINHKGDPCRATLQLQTSLSITPAHMHPFIIVPTTTYTLSIYSLFTQSNVQMLTLPSSQPTDTKSTSTSSSNRTSSLPPLIMATGSLPAYSVAVDGEPFRILLGIRGVGIFALLMRKYSDQINDLVAEKEWASTMQMTMECVDSNSKKIELLKVCCRGFIEAGDISNAVNALQKIHSLDPKNGIGVAEAWNFIGNKLNDADESGRDEVLRYFVSRKTEQRGLIVLVQVYIELGMMDELTVLIREMQAKSGKTEDMRALEQLLVEKKLHDCLLDLYALTNRHDEYLSLLTKHTLDIESVVKYLNHMDLKSQQNIDLIAQYAQTVLDKDVTMGVEVFKRHGVEAAVVKRWWELTKANSTDAEEKFLEWYTATCSEEEKERILVQDDDGRILQERIATRMTTLLVERCKSHSDPGLLESSYMSTQSPPSFPQFVPPSPRSKLHQYLRDNPYYDAEVVLDSLPQTGMWYERSLVYQRLGRIQDAVRELLKLGDFDSAEKLVQNDIQMVEWMVKEYLHIMALMNDGSKSSDDDRNKKSLQSVKRLLQLLSGIKDIPLSLWKDVITSVPPSTSLPPLLPLLKHQTIQMHSSIKLEQMHKSLLQAYTRAARVEVMEKESGNVVVGGSDVCHVCNGTLSSSLCAVVKDRLVHLSCVK